MDEAANRYARDLIDAIHAAMARDPGVQACRERARAAGFELRVSVAATAGGVDRSPVVMSVHATGPEPPDRRTPPVARGCEITAADRRFLRSLRIAVSDPT